MKSKLKIIIILGFYLMLFSFFCIALADDFDYIFLEETTNFLRLNSTQENNKIVNFTKNSLPASLEIIEDEAFEGTALSNLALSDNVIEINERAFANNTQLMTITLPLSIAHISNNAFIESKETIIRVPTSSYALYWASKNGFHVELISFLTCITENKPIAWIANAFKKNKEQATKTDTCFAKKRENRLGRSPYEIKIHRFKGISSEHIQSRFFP